MQTAITRKRVLGLGLAAALSVGGAAALLTAPAAQAAVGDVYAASGQVVDSYTNAPIAGATVTVTDDETGAPTTVPTLADGTWTVAGLPDEDDFSVAITAPGYFSNNDDFSLFGADAAVGTTRLDYGVVTITGTVTDQFAPPTTPVSGVVVSAYDPYDTSDNVLAAAPAALASSAATGADGTYTLSVDLTKLNDDYLVLGFAAAGYNSVFGDGEGDFSSQWSGDNNALYTGDFISTAASQRFTADGYDAQLIKSTDLVTLSGSVTNQSGTGLAGVRVSGFSGADSVVTDGAGNWSVQVPTNSTNYLYASDLFAANNVRYIGEFYGNTPYSSNAMPVVASASEAGLNITLPLQAQITGSVSGPGVAGQFGLTSTGTDPYRSVSICAYDVANDSDNPVTCTSSQQDGSYTLTGLPAGTFQLQFSDNVDNRYATVWLGSTTLQTGSATVAVTAGATVTAPAQPLTTGVTIAGTVTGGSTGSNGISVDLYSASAGYNAPFVTSGSVSPSGAFVINNVLPGTYKVKYGYAWIGGTDFPSATTYTLGAGSVLNFTAPAVGNATGQVLGTNGSRPSELLVLTNRDGKTVAAYFNSGTFSYQGLPVGSYKLTVSDPTNEYATQSVLFSVTANTVTPVPTIQLLPTPSAPKALSLKTAPAITGTATVGKTLKVSAGSWAAGVTPAYQWLRGGKAIAKATGASYKLTTADIGKKISVKVSVSATGYTANSAVTKATAKVKTTSTTKVTAKALGGGKVKVTVKVTGKGATATGKVKVTIGKKKATVKLAKAKGSATISGQKAGKKVTVKAAYAGAGSVLKSSKSVKVTVK